MSGDEAAARAALERAPDSLDDSGTLHAAAALGNVAAIRCLLGLGADPNATADDGTTALHQAAWNDRRAAAEFLVAHGARPLRDANHESTPAGWANHAGHAALRDYLLDHCPGGLDLVSFGRVDALRRYLAEHPDFATGTLPGGGSPLHRLCDDTDQAPRSTAGERPANRGQWRVRLPHNRTAGVDILPRETGCLNTSTIHGSPAKVAPGVTVFETGHGLLPPLQVCPQPSTVTLLVRGTKRVAIV